MAGSAKELMRLFERNRDRAVLTDVRDGRSFTYGEFLTRSLNLAAALESRGVGAGEPVVFSAENSPELAQLYFAALHLGARVVPINPNYLPADYSTILSRVQPRWFICSASVRTKVRDVLTRHSGVKSLCFHPPIEMKRDALAELVNLDVEGEATRGKDPARTLAAAAEDDVGFTMFTSGSTGTPKGINIRIGGILENGRKFCHRLGLGPHHRFYNILSMTYLGGLYNLFLIPVLAEGHIVLDGVFGPANLYAFWERVKDCGVNALWFSPTMLSMLLAADDGEDVSWLQSQVRIGICGMAPLPIDLKRRFEERFGLTLYENYGLSETTFLTTNAPDLPAKTGSVGRPIEGVSIRIVGPDWEPVANGREGQVLVKTPYLMAGYDQAETTDRPSVLPSGYFLTGDVGYTDVEGDLFITGRSKDLIIRGGINISPKSIEDVIYRLDGVTEAAVIGVPHTVYGEEVALVVQVSLSEKDRLSIDAVRKFCDKNIAQFQRPKHVFFIDEMPRGSTGKVQKSALKKLLSERLDPLAD
jgi:acyl-CoA synthetase (AMP-forming)/AMP-acid ligase II